MAFTKTTSEEKEDVLSASFRPRKKESSAPLRIKSRINPFPLFVPQFGGNGRAFTSDEVKTDTSHKKGHPPKIHKSNAFPPGESARLLFKEKRKHLISIRQHRRDLT